MKAGTSTGFIYGLQTYYGHVITFPSKEAAQERIAASKAEGYDPKLVVQMVVTTRSEWTEVK